MAASSPVTPLISIDTSRLDWSIKVRVLRMWCVRSSVAPEKIIELQLILLDQEGKKIQATVPAQCVDRLSNVLYEDAVYVISFFKVAHNVSNHMIVFNPFMILFLMNTVVIPSHSLVIPHYSLDLFPSQKIRTYSNGFSYLIDVVGVVSDVHSKPTDVGIAVKVTLGDQRGICECILLGDYVSQLKIMLCECCPRVPILVLQFVKIKNKGGFVYVESVENITKLFMNPPFAEVENFMDDIGLITDYYQFVDKGFYSSSTLCKELEFNGLYPHKTLFEFVRTLEEGLFVLCCKVVGLFQVKQWFYPVCRCGEFLEFASGAYYCVRCHVTVFSIPPSCKLQVSIQDGTSAALLPMSENLLRGIDCIEHNGTYFAANDDCAKSLNDKMILLIVNKKQRVDELSDKVVEIVRVTDDIEILKRYHIQGTNFTPTKSKIDIHSLDSPLQANVTAIVSSAPKFVGKKPVFEETYQAILNDSAREYDKKYQEFKVRCVDGFSHRGASGDASSSNMI